MGEYLDRLPARVREHIWQIARSAGGRRVGEAADLIARGWLARRARYEAKVRTMEMEEALRLPKDDCRGCLAMTVSGSLLSLGRMRDNGRTAQYVSIHPRGDVPAISTHISSLLAEDVVVGRPVVFEKGPIVGSSPVYRIALALEDLDLEAEAGLIV